jgi:hypothetical protein
MQAKFLRRMSLAVIGFVAASVAFGQPGELSRSVLQGAWEQVDGPGLVRIHDDQLLRIEQGMLLIRGIVHYRPGSLVLRTSGELETWQATLGENGHLRLGHGKLNLSGGEESHDYRKLPSVPASLELQPLTLGPMQPLPPERVQAIQQELASHNEQEQKERRDKAIVTDNTDYLVKLVQEVGWIDVARFGEKASGQATIMIKHTGSLPFMIAVLPYVEKDLKYTGGGQTYAVLYDSVQLALGKKQCYGTQIGFDAKGAPYILPLEDPAKVDDYLKEIGVYPLAKYREEASKVLFKGQPIRLATPEESE